MRDCVFLVADAQIEAMVSGFLTRQQYHLSLGCKPFDFHPRKDIVVHPQRDPGVYTRGIELLAPYRTSHRRAVVILDAAWEGSPGHAAIRTKISRDLAAQWPDYLVIVLEPELEVWIWQDSVHVVKNLGATDFATLRASLEQGGFWRAGESKPHKPKEAVEHALRRARIPRSAVIYKRIAASISVTRCVDPALVALRDGFKGWFGQPT